MRKRLEEKIVAMAVLYNNELQSVWNPVGSKFNVLGEADSATTKAASMTFLAAHLPYRDMHEASALTGLCHFATVCHRAWPRQVAFLRFSCPSHRVANGGGSVHVTPLLPCATNGCISHFPLNCTLKGVVRLVEFPTSLTTWLASHADCLQMPMVDD